MMELIQVVSSNLQAIAYAQKTLYVQFKSGDTYLYEGVPYDYFDSMQKVESVGKFFCQYIRNKFPFKKIGVGGVHAL
jgi:hypothetical protein